MIAQGTNESSQRMTLSADRSLLTAIVVAWLLCAFASLLATGAARMTAPAHTLQTAISCACASGLVILPGMLICRLMLRKIWSKRLCLLLAAMAALMCIGVIINLQGWCPYGNLDSPLLDKFYTDSGREWDAAIRWRDGNRLPYEFNTGYPLTLIALNRIFGAGILTPAMFSAFCMLLTCAVTAAVAVRLLPSMNPRKVGMAAAAMFAIVPSIIWYGTIALKEGPLCFGFSLCIYALASTLRERITLPAIFAGAAGALITMLLKSPMGWFLMAGAAMLFLKKLSDRTTRHLRSGYSGILFLLLLGGAIVIGGRNFRARSDASFILPIEEAGKVEEAMQGYESVQPYTTLIGNYHSSSPAYRLTKLPLAAVAQYFPPFPWNFTRDSYLGRFVPWAHLPFWYLVGGCILAYYILCLGRRNRSGSLGLWSLWVLLCWLGIAYSSGGTVARYWLPLLPAMIPLGLQAVACVCRGQITTRVATVYSITYFLLLVAALISAYRFLHS